MVNLIPPGAKKIWDDWNIRGLMLFSLSLQTILILLAPFRKGTANKLIIILIWSVYLLADWAANFAVGLISDSQRDASESSMPAEDNYLLAFWPPFLLLHLGGPDTITAFSLEDNELWIRHLLGLIFQALAAVYVFLLSFPRTKLAIPTLLMFLSGIIKYLERTRALYLASMDRFRDSMLKEPDPGPNYAKLMDDIASKKEANLPTTVILLHEQSHQGDFHSIQTEEKRGSESNGSQIEKRDGSNDIASEDRLDDLQVVHYAYHYFEIFKGLIVDLIFSFHERNESRNFFLNLSAGDALRVIEVELNFIYDALYTKVQVVHSKLGCCMRFISFASVVAALSLFYFHVQKSGFHKFDVRITYILFLGAIALDTLAFFMLVFSDWTFAALSDPENVSTLKIKPCIAATIRWFLVLKRPRWYQHKDDCKVLATPFLLRRWSGHVSGHNLIRYCLKGWPTKFHKVKNCVHCVIEIFVPGFSGGKIIHASSRVGSFVSFIYGKAIHTEGRVSQFFSSIGQVMHAAGRVSQFFSFIGQVIHLSSLVFNKVIDSLGLTAFVDEIRYLSHEPLPQELWEFIFHQLKEKSCSANDPKVAKEVSSSRGDWILKKESHLHLKKDLLPYLTEVAYDESLLLWHIATELLYYTEEDVTSKHHNKHRYFSKLLSDYMLYLLVMQPSMMSIEAGIGLIRFRDTCAEAKRLFRSKNLGPAEEKEACEEILDVKTYVKPATVKGDRSKSVLFDASLLVQALNGMDDIEKGAAKEDKWELISKIWVELLSYAACNCVARTHAQQVSYGGELITFVWLLMAHFGIGRQFQINKGQGRTKLIVGK